MKRKILALITIFTPIQSFSTPRLTSCRSLLTPLHADGGTDWIKDAMGQPKEPEFTPREIEEMEKLIVTLSKESNDDKRREQLSAILGKELKSSETDSSPELDAEIPRFAKLFQLSLDIVGERVQNAAREKAMERQEMEGGNDPNTDATNEPDANGEGVVERLKSEEELQLWALIDMMVQSKTAVKLHMGSLGSKGSFR